MQSLIPFWKAQKHGFNILQKEENLYLMAFAIKIGGGFGVFCCRNMLKWLFWGKFGRFYPKIAVSAHFDSRKIRKKQNIKKPMPIFVAKTLRYIYTSFWAIWIIFHGLDIISVEKKNAKFLPRKQKNCVFLAKNRRKFFLNFQNFGNQYKPLKYTSSQILGHLDHFWPKNGYFWPFLGHILPYFL